MKGFLPIWRYLLVEASTEFRARCIITNNEYALWNRMYVHQHIDIIFLRNKRYHHLINNCIRAASYSNNSYTIKWKNWMDPTMKTFEWKPFQWGAQRFKIKKILEQWGFHLFIIFLSPWVVGKFNNNFYYNMQERTAFTHISSYMQSFNHLIFYVASVDEVVSWCGVLVFHPLRTDSSSVEMKTVHQQFVWY